MRYTVSDYRHSLRGGLSSPTQAEAIHPAKISKADAAGQIFQRPDTAETEYKDGHKTLDVTSLLGASEYAVTGVNAKNYERWDDRRKGRCHVRRLSG